MWDAAKIPAWRSTESRELATQLEALTCQRITIRDGKAVITDTAA